jgi:hypothetical protein
MVSPLPWPSSRLRPELLDGVVLARSAYHHSMNYRSVVVLGTAVEVTDETERLVALETISEHIIRGRWTEIRPPNPLELKATRVLPLPIEEASAKVRTGPPVDDEDTICAAGPVCCPSRLTWAPRSPICVWDRASHCRRRSASIGARMASRPEHARTQGFTAGDKRCRR